MAMGVALFSRPVAIMQSGHQFGKLHVPFFCVCRPRVKPKTHYCTIASVLHQFEAMCEPNSVSG